ncbi:Dimethlysulfonioproprionate lyase [Lachnellula occidentalis]|uniref:Dimethlysulfonioproprionate lyase n=1 Tax=Lachnellula occidentalis TaxID=215460 RepID=A0A8H8UIQ5_9HELO|nr:Dimethlysulfonioproprionate lyase [Lachnellula occidentalis]
MQANQHREPIFSAATTNESKLPPLGFVAVEVNILRPPGDPFNERTWPFPLIREKMSGSTESQIVTRDGYDSDFIDRFVDASLRLAERGAVGIITSCGFLAMAQQQIAERVPIPIATSALIQIPLLRALLPASKAIGVLTYDGDRLGEKHLLALGIVPANVHIRGCPANGHLRHVIQDGGEYNAATMEEELISEASELIKQHPSIRALVLECTQMPPYAKAIQERIGLPVYDVYTMGMWFYSGLSRSQPECWTMI